MQVTIDNLPDFQNDMDKSLLRSRVLTAVNDMLNTNAAYKDSKRATLASEPSPAPQKTGAAESADAANGTEDSGKKHSIPLDLKTPQFSFDQVILDDKIVEELQYVIKFERVRGKVYGEWGLSKIEKSPKQALNFWGDSGTGKTMTAEALAHVMGKKIILASYADIESKYHGDGPKNARYLFEYAAQNDAVLFIDEADSLLSQRVNATQGAEQAANSLRSELLIQIEKFSGIVIFATNLASNYDKAFVTRIKSLHFEKPNKDLRRKLWEKMLFDSDIHLPFDPDNPIDLDKLSEIEDICGRDIKNAVIKTAVKTAINGGAFILQQDLEDTTREIADSNLKVQGKLSAEERKEVGAKIQRQIRKDEKRKRNLYRRSL